MKKLLIALSMLIMAGAAYVLYTPIVAYTQGVSQEQYINPNAPVFTGILNMGANNITGTGTVYASSFTASGNLTVVGISDMKGAVRVRDKFRNNSNDAFISPNAIGYIDFDVAGANDFRFNGDSNSDFISRSHNHYFGDITAVSSVTLTTAQFGVPVRPYIRTEAQLKTTTPGAEQVGSVWYDSTNLAIVVATGTTVAAFGQVTSGKVQPTDW